MDFSTNRLEIFQELSATEKSLRLTNIFLLLKKQPNLSWLKTLSTLDPGSCSAARQAEEFCTWFPITSARLIRYPPAFNQEVVFRTIKQLQLNHSRETHIICQEQTIFNKIDNVDRISQFGANSKIWSRVNFAILTVPITQNPFIWSFHRNYHHRCHQLKTLELKKSRSSWRYTCSCICQRTKSSCNPKLWNSSKHTLHQEVFVRVKVVGLVKRNQMIIRHKTSQ